MSAAQSQHPLRGVVLCGTSLDQDVRAALGDSAQEMGAIHSLDLTSAVTHLLVGNIDTAKYKHVAKARPDIKVLRPEWITAVRDAWIIDDVNLPALTEEYRLPPFYNLNICITGFDDLSQRDAIQKSVDDNGGIYHKDLTKHVSHLVAAKPQGAKYDRAKQWGMKIVSLKWLEESLQRGMTLEERLYDPLMPVEKQGHGAFIRAPLARTSPKRAREDSADGSREGMAKRRMRRTASSRLNSDSKGIWAGISQPEQSDSPAPDAPWAEDGDILRPPSRALEVERSVIGDSFAAKPQTWNRAGEPKAVVSVAVEPHGLFHNWVCLPCGHEDRIDRTIRKILTDNDATVVEKPDGLEHYASNPHYSIALVLPSRWTAQQKPLPKVPTGTEFVTEMWVERCIIYKTLLAPTDDVLSRSFNGLSKNCFKGQIVASTGLKHEVKQVAQIVQATGGTYIETLDKKASVLIINPEDADWQKPMYAKKHRIPVVTLAWFLQSLALGSMQRFSDYNIPDPVWQQYEKEKDREVEPGENRAEDAVQHKPDVVEQVKRQEKTSAQRLSATRRRAMTPSLALARSKLGATTAHVSSRDQPTMPSKAPETNVQQAAILFKEDTPSPKKSQPLEDLPPAMNSPQKRHEDHDEAQQPAAAPSIASLDGDFSADQENIPSLNSVAPSAPAESAMVDQSELNKTMTELLVRQRSGLQARTEAPLRRKERKLGRAPSGNSAALSFTRPTRLEVADSVDTASPITFSGTGGDDKLPLPSQLLTYDAPGAEEHRRLMSTKMGMAFEDEEASGKRVGGIGVVKDAEASGVGQRLRGRNRDR
ncbi:hypothetical protein MBLNU457_5940t1 [Dothideomycetes sp. NU457]